jgi:hypothetical protein
MRLASIALAALMASAAANAAYAQAESFFQKRYCTMGGGNRSSGMADCSYNTWEQCRASASGLGRYCIENPYWRSQGSAGRHRPER